MPDVLIVLCDRTVRGEESGFADVDEHFLGPFGAVRVGCIGLFAGLDVILKVREAS